MKIVNVNLISFSSTKSIGTFVYVKRLLAQISIINPENLFFYIYVRTNFDINGFVKPENSEIIYVPLVGNSLKRILFEQTFFYLYLKKADFFFTPCLSLPLFVRSYKVLTIHDMVPFIIKGKYGFFRKYFIPFMTKIAAQISDLIITVSNNSKRDIIFYLNVSEKKIQVIYNFIQPDEEVVLKQSDKLSLEKFGITKPFFLNVSTLQPGKNVEGLIRAFQIFISSNKDYQLCVVGNKGWGYDSIYNEVKNRGLEQDVIFTGYLEDSILAQFYNKCIGTVYVSFYEGFGIPPLEGFYHSKATVCSNNSSLPEVVGDAAVLVDPRNEKSIAEGLSTFIQKRTFLENNIADRLLVFNPYSITQKFLLLFK